MPRRITAPEHPATTARRASVAHKGAAMTPREVAEEMARLAARVAELERIVATLARQG